MAGALLSACGGSRPSEERPSHREREDVSSPEQANGQGAVTFRYSNKSTSADLHVDLGATDISLEMSGKPAEEMKAPQGAALSRKRPEDPKPNPESEESAATDRPEEPALDRKTAKGGPAKPDPRAKAAKPETQPEHLPEDTGPEESANPDVTDKVLLGIRKAQEFFYQKRYPEALQMVRSSLDARPTAEGHALAGSIHYMMGATGLARRHWQQALRLNPDMPAVTNMLEKIATPGGRGSPHPRPLAPRRAAAAPPPSVIEAANPGQQAPFPEEFGEPSAAAPAAPTPSPYRAPAPAATPAPVAAPIAPPAPEPEPAAPIEEAAAPSPSAPEVAAPATPVAKEATPVAKPKFPQKAAGADAGKDKSP